MTTGSFDNLLVSSINIDFGTVTILYSQPVAALQILSKDGSWKWVRHIENALVRNNDPKRGCINHQSHYPGEFLGRQRR